MDERSTPPEDVPVAVVSGSSGALGGGIARALVDGGYRVVGLDRSARQAGDSLHASYALDVVDEVACRRVFEEIARAVGPPRVLVCAAGVIERGSAAATSLDSWNRVLQTNLTGTFVVAREFNRVRVASGASVVSIGSMRGEHSSPGAVAYAVSKAGIHHLTRLLSREWGPTGCRVNAVAPAAVAGNGQAAEITSSPGYLDAKRASIPVGRLGTSQDVANAVLYLCSDRASFVNGTVLAVDGGEYA
ncbi:SDR family NAD(P)-dependent oxidoreductase [Streptomyces canus]|uniref:SDR family NAD(P)-dependent oxidoreductase n=1 Tax=Streptomyces canus TaxID=58343 RepID=UPI00035DFB09|nr:SDR family oxidoreductase [Streptomyces canus]